MWRSPGWYLGVQFGNLLLIQATTIKIASSCQDFNGRKRKGKAFYMLLLFPPKPCPEAKISPRGETGWSMGFTDGGSSLQPKAHCPTSWWNGAENSKRAHSGCVALFHKQLFQLIVWLSSTKGYLLGIFSSDSHTPPRKGLPMPTW